MKEEKKICDCKLMSLSVSLQHHQHGGGSDDLHEWMCILQACDCVKMCFVLNKELKHEPLQLKRVQLKVFILVLVRFKVDEDVSNISYSLVNLI